MIDIEEVRKSRKNLAKRAFLKGLDTIYTYGLDILALDRKNYYELERHLVSPLTIGFEPNPFRYQYDLEVHIFLNYDNLVKRQIELIENAIKKTDEGDPILDQLNDKLEFVTKYGTGFPRSEHFWNAAELRWPTDTKSDGRQVGLFMRDPWGEDFINGVCEKEYVYMFGGSGQGKTHRAIAFMCIIWDHFIDTQMGGRCRFSTVAEDKMKESTWPYLQRIYAGSRKGISLYCGRGVRSGDYTIARPHDKKGGSSIKGILIPRRNDNVAVDKITGSHGHPVGIYHIDELQATPEAPIEASPNFLQNCTFGWITASGNFDLNNDSLGKNVKPKDGWDSVDENTHIYTCVNMLGIESLAIHYNNDLSPAFEGEGAKKWWYLPTKEKKEQRYPTPASRRTNAYRRLWIGWREKSLVADAVFNMITLKEMGAMERIANFDPAYPITHGWSFDSAPTSTDRNILTHFADGVDYNTKKWKIHFYESIGIPKIDNSLEYIRQATNMIMEYSKKWGVKSGNAILDWTNITGLPESFLDRGFIVRTMVYNQAPPDGIRKDKRTKFIHPKVVVQADTGKFAHQETTNYISMGALLAQNFLLSGQISGLHDGYVNDSNSNRSFEEEICLRKFNATVNKTLGELLSLEPKHSKGGRTGFTKTHGFSPDILDTIFQACAFVAIYRGMIPGLFKGNSESYIPQNEDSKYNHLKSELSFIDNASIMIDRKEPKIDEPEEDESEWFTETLLF